MDGDYCFFTLVTMAPPLPVALHGDFTQGRHRAATIKNDKIVDFGYFHIFVCGGLI